MFNHDNGLFAFNNKINFINIVVPSYVGFLPNELLICLQNWHDRTTEHSVPSKYNQKHNLQFKNN
jgi:hypothetical protein